MNSSKTNELLNNLNDKLNDLNDKTSYSNSSFDTLIAKNDIMSSRLGLIETDIEATNTLLTDINSDIADIGTTLAVMNKYSRNDEYNHLLWNDTNSVLTKGDYNSNPQYAWKLNNTGHSAYVKRIQFIVYTGNQIDDWTYSRFADTNDTSHTLKYGYSSTTSSLDTEYLSFKTNLDIIPYLEVSTAINGTGTRWFYCFVIKNICLEIPNNKYFVVKFDVNTNVTNHDKMITGFVWEK